MQAQSTLHYIAPDHLIGDVHPYYNEADGLWYMFYLMPGDFAAALLTSEDMLHWTPQPTQHKGGKLAPYYVLGVIKDGEAYRSWFGYGTSMCATQSTDLRTFENAAYGYTIPLDLTTYPSGARDPYVFHDPDAGVYRVICTAYLTNQLQGKGQGMACRLAVGQTKGDSLDDWGKIDTTLMEMDGLSGEPECSQVLKIGDRWYVFASMARRHPNHVGRLSYFIGDAGKGFLEQDWAAKQEHFLTGDDICAAQLAEKDGALYLWGWIIENWQGGVWGGHLSLPLEVIQQGDGMLTTRLAPEVSGVIRGEMLLEAAAETAELPKAIDRYDADVSFQAGQNAVTVDLGAAWVVLEPATGSFRIAQPDGETHVYFDLPAQTLAGDHQLRIVAEADMLEVFLDDAWSLSARLDRQVITDQLSVSGATSVQWRVHALAER